MKAPLHQPTPFTNVDFFCLYMFFNGPSRLRDILEDLNKWKGCPERKAKTLNCLYFESNGKYVGKLWDFDEDLSVYKDGKVFYRDRQGKMTSYTTHTCVKRVIGLTEEGKHRAKCALSRGLKLHKAYYQNKES
jgi:hypothetical protein